MKLTKLSIVAFSLTTPGLVSADAVLDWNATHLQAIRTASVNPPRAARNMALVQLAVYDSVNGITRSHWPYHVTALAPAGASKDAAVAAAAKTVLDSAYAASAPALALIATQYTTALTLIPEGQPKTDGVAWGTQVANAILALRAADGSNGSSTYTPTLEPGRWRPTLPANAPGLLPFWGDVTTFGMIESAAFRPQPPPRLNTAAYATEVNQVKALGSATSTTRTANETEIGRFWADGGGTETPPGHWLHIASDVSTARTLTIDENARLFALLGIVNADAAIACWESKFLYDLWRPITAIREADTDGNPATDADPNWLPLIGTPPFPEYTSGHATFSRSSANILSRFFGTDDIAFTTQSDGLMGVTRNYTGFSAAADEAGMSRIYAGIHYVSANVAGQMCGQMISSFVFDNYLRPLTALEFTLVNHVSTDAQLELAVTAGQTYRIEASSDFVNWEVIATVNANSATLPFTDTNAPTGKRFYRAVQL